MRQITAEADGIEMSTDPIHQGILEDKTKEEATITLKKRFLREMQTWKKQEFIKMSIILLSRN